MLRYLLGHLIIITLTAPWVFLLGGRETTVAGLPLWAVYTIAMSAGYAVFVAVSYARCWDKCANTEDGQ
ncbi:hypothetical protein [Cerasicoccus fimbriatus]|uniref:hypothetical protein n=1 Tax=Cerasicoccus fimbriatus TaxID=3014554 RepID=UPI0022B59EB2|nr:hypothetical protein [Cerasicoccus sp. TK19100]